MWLFTKRGLLSVVCAREADHPGAPPDLHRFMVRARERHTLEGLLEDAGLATDEILVTPQTDYPFRVFVSLAALRLLMLHLAEGIDYDNFKGACYEAARSGVFGDEGGPSSEYLSILGPVHALAERALASGRPGAD